MADQEGYDQVNTMFTPEGRLRQVEYASKTAKRGSPVIGIKCKDGVILLMHRVVPEQLRVERIEMKLAPIDDHIMVGISGIISDARVLIDNAQVASQSNKISYDTPIDVKTIVHQVSEVLQSYTQFSGMRPFGVSLVFVGVDETGPSVYLTEPSGTFYGYRAIAVGEGDEAMREVLRESYKESMDIKQAIALAKKAFEKGLADKYNEAAVKGFVRRIDGDTFEPL